MQMGSALKNSGAKTTVFGTWNLLWDLYHTLEKITPSRVWRRLHISTRLEKSVPQLPDR
jgi:hypothetical protein